MKVKVAIVREVEVEVNDPVVSELDAYLRTIGSPYLSSLKLDEMVTEAVASVEKVVGLPFGNEDAAETIISVCALDGEPILEW